MDNPIKFFIKVGKLKTVKRRGWVLRGIKDPETFADHDCLVCLLAWIFSFGRKFNTRKLLKLALAHSLPSVNLASITSYDHLLKVRSKREIFKKYPALSLRESLEKKEEIFNRRSKEEKKALETLLKAYPSGFTDEIRYLWEDYRLGQSKEARLLSIIDKLENLIQAIIYKKELGEEGLGPFWAQCYEVIDDQRILKFIESLNEYDKEGEKGVADKENLGIIKFIFEVAKFKTIKRRGWVLRGVKNPTSIASHSVRVALMAWYFSGRKKLDQTMLFLMALIHDTHAVKIGDATPHDALLKKIKDVDKVIETFPWMGLKQEKEVIVRKNLEKEGDAVDKIFKYLPQHHHHELKYLWLEFKTGTSREARFSRQVDRVETVLQAMEYHQKDKSVSPTSFWLGIKELIDDPSLLEFVEKLDKYYYGTK